MDAKGSKNIDEWLNAIRENEENILRKNQQTLFSKEIV